MILWNEVLLLKNFSMKNKQWQSLEKENTVNRKFQYVNYFSIKELKKYISPGTTQD